MPLEALLDDLLGTIGVGTFGLKSSLFTSFSASSETEHAAASQADDVDSVLQVPHLLQGEPWKFSDDTNISSTEIYGMERKYLQPNGKSSRDMLKALDLGAGAGVSSGVLRHLGYSHVDAVDQSDQAWTYSGAQKLNGVKFHNKTAGEFMDGVSKPQFDAVNVAFAIKRQKAMDYAHRALAPGGRLLAPIATSDEVVPPGKVAIRFHLVTKNNSGGLDDQQLPDANLPETCLFFQPDVTTFPSTPASGEA